MRPKPLDSTTAGSVQGLWFHLSWGSHAVDGLDRLRLCVGEHVVWGHDQQGIPVDLGALLDELTRIWEPIRVEQFQGKADQLRAMNSDFLASHTLHAMPSNLLAPDLVIARDGGAAFLVWADQSWQWHAADVVRTLGVLGDRIAERPGLVCVHQWQAAHSKPMFAAPPG